jgi:pyruvate formate lyase activating enzyme
MKIGGLEKFTLIDYPEKISAVVFTMSCNFKCPFCHNPELVDPKKMKNQSVILEKDFFDFLKQRKGSLEGVCITGGEPTLQKDLSEFIRKIKNLGFSVKLDTNGSEPKILEKLIKENLVDYLAMDIKGPLEKYKEITRSKVNLEKIKKSAELVKNFPDSEFRTTILPVFHKKDDLIKIGEWLKGSKKFFLQQFRPHKTLDPSFENEKSYSSDDLADFCRLIKPYFTHCGVRE